VPALFVHYEGSTEGVCFILLSDIVYHHGSIMIPKFAAAAGILCFWMFSALPPRSRWQMDGSAVCLHLQ
jgi:hypothetical protein